jgi:membrane-anchored protein YejM (alkaline phosphatase superfamily)
MAKAQQPEEEDEEEQEEEEDYDDDYDRDKPWLANLTLADITLHAEQAVLNSTLAKQYQPKRKRTGK